MKITPKQLKKFKKLYSDYFSIELSDEEALAKGLSLMRLLRITLPNTPRKT